MFVPVSFCFITLRIITNNPKVKDEYSVDYEVIFIDGGYRDVLVKVRDLIHVGYKLLTHPLMGSLKPNETPYRTVAVSDDAAQADYDSIILIEDAIITYDKFACFKRPDRGENTPERLKEDFMLIDFSLIASALNR